MSDASDPTHPDPHHPAPEEAPDAETAAGPDDGGDEPRAPRSVPAGAFVVALMVAAALGILAIVALTMGGGSDAEELEDARFAAGRFAERFLTFDHESVDDWKADVLSLSTGGFSEEVDEVEEGLRRLIAEAELSAEAQVTDIFIGDIDRGTVGAVLVYDRDLRGTSGNRSESDRYMQLTMLLVDGEWLVDDVIDIATAGGIGTGGPEGPGGPGPGPDDEEDDGTTTTAAPG